LAYIITLLQQFEGDCVFALSSASG